MKEEKYMLLSFLYLMLFFIAFGFSFFVTAGIVWLICYCFKITFTWPIALGVWLILLLLK